MIVPRGPQIGRMLAYVGRPLLLLVLWDVLIVLAYKALHWEWVGSKYLPLALYGSAIGIIVGFRNNSAYARWWEARGLWGQIVNNSRSLARQVVTTMHLPEVDGADGEGGGHGSEGGGAGSEHAMVLRMQTRLVHFQIAYVHALRQQLRGLSPWDEVERILPGEDLGRLRGSKNVPLSLQQCMGEMLRSAKQRGWLDRLEWQAMDRNLDDLADAQGGTERIKNTPMPKQYDFFPMLFVQIYCLLLPIGMVENLGWFTPFGSTLVGFMFLALDKIGRDLEDPFDNRMFDVPMTAIATTIEMNLRQLLGEADLPEAATPVHGVLW